MYSALLYLYELGIFIASFFSKKVATMREGEKSAFAYLKANVDPDADYVWFHAASLGEFEQGRPIMEEFKRLYPEKKILLTFFSPSGYEVRKNYEGADLICYLPIDTSGNARRFLDIIHPTMAFFIKYEFWYNYISILKSRGVPTYSVSSIFRPEQVFFKWYGKQYSHVLKCITHFFVQNEQSQRLLQTLGISNSTITGDTRFDRVLQIARQSKVVSAVETFKDGKKVFIAGSSWGPDEEIFIPYFEDHKDWKLVIAPHVIAEEHLEQIMKLLSSRRVLRYTRCQDATAEELKEAEVMIIDCFGMLSSIYKYGDVAYVGGGFGVGIHNLPEAAVWGIPVIFGPNNQKFQEAQELKACGGGIEIKCAECFRKVMDRFIDEPDTLQSCAKAAGEYVKANSGATDKILSLISVNS